MNLWNSHISGTMVFMPVIDFHVHVFPMQPERYFPGKTREVAQFWSKSVSRAFHEVQPWLRFLPPLGKRIFDELGALVPAPLLLLESSVDDLKRAMDEANIDQAVLIAHPEAIPNEFILKVASESDRFIPAVNIPPTQNDPCAKLREYRELGAKILKIHPAADGLDAESPHYLALIDEATTLKMPIILHTGCMASHAFFKNPHASSVENFESWFKSFPNTTFILAHMNYHEPEKAMDLAERYPNLILDTSWQPIETIAEAVRRVGVKSIVFGSDWPLVGDNMHVGIGRIREAVNSELLTEEEAEIILGKNAVRILEGEGNAQATLAAPV